MSTIPCRACVVVMLLVTAAKPVTQATGDAR
jgi:hypothetical protein